MDELVSIIMPSYNTGKYIKESIQSVINQTYKNWELIIIDDCSNDNTESVVEGIRDNRIIFIKNGENSGAAISRNRALTLAKGRWIAFLDSDDIWHPSKLDKQIKFMLINDYHFSYTKCEVINENSEKCGILYSGPKVINKYKMYMYCWVSCLTVMYDREYIGLIQIENLQKNNDYAIWLKVIRKCKCYLLNENLAMYRKRAGSISNQSYYKLIRHHYLLFKNGEKFNNIDSLFATLMNLCFGVIKKLIYRRTIK